MSTATQECNPSNFIRTSSVVALQYRAYLYQQNQLGKFQSFTAWLPARLIACLHSIHHCCVCKTATLYPHSFATQCCSIHCQLNLFVGACTGSWQSRVCSAAETTLQQSSLGSSSSHQIRVKGDLSAWTWPQVMPFVSRGRVLTGPAQSSSKHWQQPHFCQQGGCKWKCLQQMVTNQNPAEVTLSQGLCSVCVCHAYRPRYAFTHRYNSLACLMVFRQKQLQCLCNIRTWHLDSVSPRVPYKRTSCCDCVFSRQCDCKIAWYSVASFYFCTQPERACV